MEKGTVKFFDRNKGFGFIIGNNGQDYFFRSSFVNGDMPKKGDAVSFVHQSTNKKMIMQEMSPLSNKSQRKEKFINNQKTIELFVINVPKK
jgi:cold shock CspA family protein